MNLYWSNCVPRNPHVKIYTGQTVSSVIHYVQICLYVCLHRTSFRKKILPSSNSLYSFDFHHNSVMLSIVLMHRESTTHERATACMHEQLC